MLDHTLPLPHLSPPHRLLHISGGSFLMGSDDNSAKAKYDGKPAHEVLLSDFCLGEFAVTQDLWAAVMGENPAANKGERLPVEQVSWFDAVVFCNRLSLETSRQPCYKTPAGQIYGLTPTKKWGLPNKGEVPCDFTANGYRLPTEAEWEYAARGGAANHARSGMYAGGDLLEQVGWYDNNSDNQTHAVGLLLPNALGLYDMSGNVWEWCHDWYDAYNGKPEKNPRGPEKGTSRVLRGGRYFNPTRYCRAAYRADNGPGDRDSDLGFRLALSLQ